MSRTRVVPIRIDNEKADYIDQKTEEWNESRGKVVEKMIEAYRQVEMVCLWGEISAEEFCQQISDLFLSGKISVEDGKITFN